MNSTDVKEATHVKCPDGSVKRIVEKIGVSQDGRLAKPSEGGFAVLTEDGKTVSMWEALGYFKE